MTKTNKLNWTATFVKRGLLSLLFLTGLWTMNASAITVFTQNFESSWTTAGTLSPAWTSVNGPGGNGNNQWQRNDFTTGWTNGTSCAYTPTGANGTSFSARVHVFDAPTGTSGDFITPIIDCSVGAATKQLSFYWIHTSGGALFNVFVSTDGGASYGASVFSGTTNAGWTLQTINIGSVTSSTVKIKFSMTNSNFNCGDIGLDEVNLIDLAPCGTPPSQPTSLVLTPVGSSVVNGTFSVAAGADGYLVVRYPSGGTPTNPVDGTNYSSGNSLGTGTVVASTSSASFSATGLVASTTYDFYLYSQNFACSGGTKYLTVAPPSLSATTNAFASATIGGLWSNAATWGGAVPTSADNVVIPAGVTVTIDVAAVINNLTVDGILQWGSTTNIFTALGNITISATGKFHGFTSLATGQQINVLGNFTNNGYANLIVSTLVFGGTGTQTLGGSGTYQGNGTKGLLGTLQMQGSGTLNVAVPLNVRNLLPFIGTISGAGNIELDNNLAQVFNQPQNGQINNVIITAMGSVLTASPVVFGAGVTAWSAITGTLNTLYYSAPNVYRCTAAASIGASAPTHTSGITDNLLWIGTLGTLGNPFLGAQSHTAGTQYFYGGNLYTCTVTGVASATAPPVHAAGIAASGAATFQYVGTPVQITLNYNAATQTVRSVNITSPGSGYSNGSPTAVMTNVGTGTLPTIATLGLPAVVGPANSQIAKNPLAILAGAPTINSSQGVSVPTSATGGSYGAAPLVGFSAPNAINYITLAGASGGSGCTVAPTATFTGGTTINGAAAGTLTVTVANGKIIGLTTTSTTAYSTPPTGITFAGGTFGVAPNSPSPAAIAALWPTATAVLNANGQLINYNLTNAGGGYQAAPTIALSTALAGEVAAGTPTCRVGLYNLNLQFFTITTINGVTPVAINGVHNESTNMAGAMPASRRINTLISGFAQGINFTGGDITLYNSTAHTFGAAAVACPIDLGGNGLIYGHYAYLGINSSSVNWVRNGSITSNFFGTATAGGTRLFPFRATGASGALQLFVGNGASSPTLGSDINQVRVTQMGAPTGTATIVTPAVTANMTGSRSFKVEILSGTTFGATLLPTVLQAWDASDNLVSDNPSLYLCQSNTGLTSGWAVRSAQGSAGSLAATGTRTTATTGNGPIVFGSTMYYGWSTSYVVPPALAYNITRTTGNSYSSIISAGSTMTWTGSFAGDEQSANLVTIPSSTFMYQGQIVTGFQMQLNGWAKLITANVPSVTNASSYFNISLANISSSYANSGSTQNVIAPFWSDLTTAGSSTSYNNFMRYSIGAGAAGTRKITMEWFNMTIFASPGPQLSFQAVLDESDNSITFNYGLFQAFNGTANIGYMYTSGINGFIANSYGLPAGQVLSQQYENSNVFSNAFCNAVSGDLTGGNGSNRGMIAPECNSSVKFTPGAYAGGTIPPTTPPVNDNVAGAIVLPALTAFPSNLCGDFYSSRYATPSPQTVCAGTADDDVWFKFNAVDPNTQVRLYGSAGYTPRVQILDQFLAPLAPTVCAVGTVGSTVTATIVANPGDDYYVRVYHDGGGVQATGTANINGSGNVTSITMTNNGNGYNFGVGSGVTTPRIRFTGGGGTDALGTAVMTGTSPNGSIGSITINDGGYGYTSAPTVTIESPNWGLTGEFAIVIFAKAANDECATATTLTNVNNTSCVDGQNKRSDVTTAAATASTDAAPLCGVADDDVWYKFTASSTLTDITVTGLGNLDPAFEVWNGGVSPGNCGTKTTLSCINATGANGIESTNVTTVIGNTYFVRVYDALAGFGGAGASFDICVKNIVPPANDNCASAVSITAAPNVCTSPVSGTTVLATQDGPGSPSCTTTSLNDVWYSFVANGTGSYTIDVTNTAGDLVVELFSGTCGAFTSIGCADVPAIGTELLSGGILAAGTYYYRVMPFNGADANFTTCVYYVTPLPGDDYCVSPIVATLNGTLDCRNTTNYTINGDPIISCSAANNTVWYTYTPSVSGQVYLHFEIPGATSNGLDGWVQMYTPSGACPSLTLTAIGTCTEFGFAIPGQIDNILSPSLTGGVTYYIMIDGFSGDVGDYCFNIQPVPTCLQPTSLTASVSSNSANLSWTCTGCTGTYEVEYGLTGFTQGSGTMIDPATNPQAVTGLLYSTTYQYYVRQDCGAGDWSTWSGPFSFTTGGPPPANDLCSGAITVACGSTTPGTLVDATFDTGLPAGCAGGSPSATYDTPGVWYKFTGNGQNVEISTCASGAIDTRISVFTGSCGSFTCEGSNDDDNSCSFYTLASTVSFPTMNGTVYYIYVHKYSTFTIGNTFNLSIVCTTCTPTAGNDNCSGAATLSNGVLFAGNNTCAGGAPSTPSCVSFSTAYDVWYKINSGLSTSLQIDISAVSATGLAYAVHYGACGSLTQVYCSTFPPASNTLTLPGTPSDYYIQVWTTSLVSRGDFDLTATLSGGACMSANAGYITPGCAGETLHLTSAVTFGTGPYTYQWSGTGTFSNAAGGNIDVTGAATGTYTVTITDTGNPPCSITKTVSVIVNPAPVVGVSTPFSVCQFDDLTLTASNDATPLQDPNFDTYSWSSNAANGYTSALQTFNVTSSATSAQDAGTYTVILTNQFGCTATDNIVVSVITAPVMTATVTGVGCTGQCNGSVQVSATGGAGGYTYSDVSFTNSNTDGDFSLNQANGPIAICAGAYSIVVSDALTCSRTQSFNVGTISTAAPTASVLLPPIVNLPQFACNGTAVSNINVPTVANATYYIWDAPTNTVFANGQSIDTNSTPTANITFGALFAANSGYYIGVQAANGCGPSIRKVQWVRGTLSVPSFTGPSIICTGTGPQTYTMTNAPIAGAQNYTWTGPTGSTINGSPSPLLNTSATSISLDVSGVSGGFTSGNICVQANAACITTAPKCIAITRVPNNLGVVSGAASVCPGIPGAINYTVPNPGVTGGTYNWVLPANTSGSSTSNSINITFNPGFIGGTLSVSYTNVCGQTSAVRTKSITIGSPTVPASITTGTGATTGLCGIPVTFTANPPQTGATFNWTFPTGSTPATATGTSAASTMPSSYTQGQVCVTASNACGTSSPARCITVKGIPATPGATTPPAPWCAPAGGIQFTGNTGNLGGTYNLNWVVIPASSVSSPIGANTNVYQVDWDSAGAASVNLTASNACGSTTRTLAVNVPGCVRIGDVAPEVTATDYSFAVNPNPATTVINYEFTASAANTTVINILDISGRVVMTTAVKTSEGFNSGQIDISQLAKGVYSLQAKSTDGTSVVKVVVE